MTAGFSGKLAVWRETHLWQSVFHLWLLYFDPGCQAELLTDRRDEIIR
jgi:hypothetical protein